MVKLIVGAELKIDNSARTGELEAVQIRFDRAQ